MKKFLSMVLAALIAAGSATAYAVEVEHEGAVTMADGDLQVGDSFIEGDLQYKVLDDGTLEVSCPEDKKDTLTQAVIPSEVNGKRVTSIGDSAFLHCSSLENVTIPDGVTSIGNSSFMHCSSLESVIIPDSVTRIGKCAFEGCSSLTSVTIGNSAASIDNWAFDKCISLTNVTFNGTLAEWGAMDIRYYNTPLIDAQIICTDGIIKQRDPEAGNSFIEGELQYTVVRDGTLVVSCPSENKDKLTEVTIPTSVNGRVVTSIGKSAFKDCTSLTSVTIPNSVTSIGFETFEGCTSLTSVTIPDSVTSIGTGAFRGTPFLNNMTDPVKYAGNIVIGCDMDVQTVVLKPGTTGINDSVFHDCTSLTSVTIPNSVTSIGSSAFSGCTSLTSVTIPKGVTRINNDAFRGCTSLTSVTIPDSVTSIGNGAFNGCTSLTLVTIPDSVTWIGDDAFGGCTSLTSVTIPDSVTSIGNGAFFGCTSLTSVTIPDSVTSIDGYAFGDCTSLTSVTIPNSVTSIGGSAFSRCTNLKNVFYFGTEEQWKAIQIDLGNGYLIDATIHYNSTGPIVEGDLEYTDLEDGTLEVSCPPENKDKLINVTIPSSVNGMAVTSIGEAAFKDCTNLTSVTIPNSVTSISAGAFYDCTSLTSVTIPNSVTSISAGAFYDCTSLTSVTIPNSVTSISTGTFYGCTNLTSVTLPNSVTGIDYGAFGYCSSLTSITIPNSVTYIDDYAFYGCTNLTSATMPDSVTSIGDYAFYGCASLTSVTIPDSVTSISNAAFYGCTGLTAINVDKENKNYSSENGILFNKDKTNLILYPAHKADRSYTVPDSVLYVNRNAFKGSTSLTAINVGEVYVGENASFMWSEDGVLILVSFDSSYPTYELIQYPAGKTDKSYAIPNNITNIDDAAFYGCTSLTSVTIPNRVTSIRAGAFHGCTNLKDVYYSGTEEQWQAIKIALDNDYLTGATIHYESTGPAANPVEIKIPTPETGAPEITDLHAQTTVNGKTLTLTIDKDGNFNLSGVSDGDYQFTFSAKNCAPRTYNVTVSGDTVTCLDNIVELHLYGDIDGDGKVNMKDVGKANAHAKNTAKLSGYDLSVSDINGDGKINMQDVGLMNAHAKNTKSLW